MKEFQKIFEYFYNFESLTYQSIEDIKKNEDKNGSNKLYLNLVLREKDLFKKFKNKLDDNFYSEILNKLIKSDKNIALKKIELIDNKFYLEINPLILLLTDYEINADNFKKISEISKNINNNTYDSIEELLRDSYKLIDKHFLLNISNETKKYTTLISFNEDKQIFINNLFKEDLYTLYKNGNIKKDNLLRRYLSKNENPYFIENSINLVRDKVSLNETTYSKWPSKYNLSFMQQFSVNKFFSENENNNLLSINGPPGTGKTTLLKDVIAQIIFEKANAIIKLSKENKKAYIPNNFEYDLKDYKNNKMFFLNEDINQTITVLSANNSAVENISKELPDIDKVDDIKFIKEFEKLNYFRDINLLDNKIISGSFSIPLGKKENFKKLSNIIFNDLKDIPQKNNVSFNELITEFEKKKKELDELINMMKIIEDLNYRKISISKLENKISKLHSKKELLLNNLKNYLTIYKKLNKFHFIPFSHLFFIFNKEIKDYKIKIINMKYKISDINNIIIKEEIKMLEDKNSLMNDIIKKLNVNNINSYEIAIKHLKSTIIKKEEEGIIFKERYILKYKEDNKDSETYFPYFGKYNNALNDLRIQMFYSSLEIIKQFIIDNFKSINSNLRFLSNIHNNKIINYDKENYNKAVSSAWRTLHLIFPVSSSTFASYNQMHKDIKEMELDYLLIDEAGQALPHLAVSSLYRHKKAMIVGDPLQIEPVNSIPVILKKLIDIDLNDVDIFYDSIQTIADRANSYKKVISDKEVGIPLNIHRRCIEPMFSISNKITYQNTMILPENMNIIDKEEIDNIIGQSKWFNIRTQNKQWINNSSKNEIDLLYKKINKIINGVSNFNKEIYIISPFRDVVYEITNKFKDEKYDNIIKIGTTHTFQGKEADIVFFVLGGKKVSSIKWAGEKSNILNVAATRAKKRFYIIGDYHKWSENGLVFNELSNLIESENIDFKIEDVPIFYPKIKDDNFTIRLKNPKEHRYMLILSLLTAKNEIIISSPFPPKGRNPLKEKLILDFYELKNNELNIKSNSIENKLISIINDISKEEKELLKNGISFSEMLERNINKNENIKIIFYIRKEEGKTLKENNEALKILKDKFPNNIIVREINNMFHNKTYISDNFVIEGSYNWLSHYINNNEITDENYKDSSILYLGQDSFEHINDIKEEMESLYYKSSDNNLNSLFEKHKDDIL